MLMGPDGEQIRYIPPPPPPPPPPTPQQLQSQVTTDQSVVSQDQSRVRTVQADLTRAQSPDAVRVQQVIQLDRELSALQAQLKTDQAALTRAQTALNDTLAAQLPRQTNQALKGYGAASKHAPGAQGMTTATTNLQSATFNEEVLVYEQTHGGKCAVPGSKQWQQDAQSMLADGGARRTARDVVTARHLRQLSGSGLDLQHFAAQEWAGEAVVQAQMQDPQTVYGSTGACPTLEQKRQGEQGAANSLSSSLDFAAKSGVDPWLARQALLGNGYVTTLGHEITQTMQGISGSKNQTSADGIRFLWDTVGNRSFDPGLATALIGVAAPLLQQYLHDQSAASPDQASQAFVYAAGLYDVLLNARQAGMPGAGELAQQLAQWSYTAANATTGKLDDLLTKVQTKTKEQQVPANLLHMWEGLARSASSTCVGNDNTRASWVRFQTSLDGDAQLKAQPLVRPSAPGSTVPTLTADQVHSTYDTALGFLSGQQRNGTLPTDIDPVVLAAVQTQMTAGFGASDQVALARAMIAGQQQQLELGWQKQHHGQPVLMPVNALTGQAGAQVLGMGDQIGLDGKSWSDAVSHGLQGMQASAPKAPSHQVIDATDSAYERLRKAKASGDASAIAAAQQALNEAVMRELQAVYGGRFSGNTLISDDENADWRYQAEVQVMRDHAGSKAMLQQVSVGLQAGEIVALSLKAGQDVPTSVRNLDLQLTPLQQPGTAPGSDPVSQAVLGDARVRSLVTGQVGLATSGTSCDPTAALRQEATVLAPYEKNDPNGVLARQIITGVVGSSLTREITANASNAAARGHDPLGTAAPLMQAAQLSPTLALTVYHSFDLPGSGQPGRTPSKVVLLPNAALPLNVPPSLNVALPLNAAPSTSVALPLNAAPPSNALTNAAGSVRNADDYRNLAIIYAALPDNVQTVAVPEQVTQAQAAKAGLIRAFGAQLSQPNSVAAQNVRSWIQASFSGTSSAAAWLANDLTAGYQYLQGGKIQTVGKLGDGDLVSTVKDALYQHDGKGDDSTPSPGSTVDMAAAASVDGSTLQEFGSDEALTGYVARAYGVRPTSGGGGPGAVYDPNTIVYGHTTLRQIVADLEQQAGVTSLSVDDPIVLQAAPVTIGEQQGAQFRVQRQDGSTVWLGPDGAVTQGWSGQDAALTHNLSTTAVQVVGGVTEADPLGNVNPLLKIDTPPPPPPPSHPWWESVAEDALAVTVGVVGSLAFDPVVGFAAAFAVQQLFDAATNDGKVTVFKFGYDLVRGKASWNETEQFGIDAGTELISAAADAFAPGAAKAVAGQVIDKVVADAAIDLGASVATDAAATGGTEALAATTDAAATTVTDTAAEAGIQSSDRAARIAAKWGAASLGQRVLASGAGAAAQSTVQGVAGLSTGTIDLGVRGELNWKTFGKAAGKQVLNIVLGTATGGMSGGLSPNIIVQTAAGFGSGVLTTEADDQVFDHHNLTTDEWLTALLMTLPMTAQHYAERAGGPAPFSSTPGRGTVVLANDPSLTDPSPVTADVIAQAPIDGPPEVPPNPGAVNSTADPVSPQVIRQTSALSADYHPQPTWVLSPETRSEIAAMLEEWNASGGPPVSLGDLPRISLPSGGPPHVPSRIPEQVYRTVRLDLEKRLAPLPLVRYQNRDWEVSGAHGDGIILRAVGTRNRIVGAHDLIGTTAEGLNSGTSWHTGPGDLPDTLSLIDPATGEVQHQIPATSLLSDTIVFSSPPSEDGGTETTKWVPVAVDSDPNAGLSRIQLQRLDVPAFEKKISHSEIEGPVLVRLKGREREGAFSLRFDQGGWIARGDNEEFPVSADDVIGDYQDFPAYAFDRFTLRTTDRQFWDEQTGASGDTGVTHPDVPTALAASGLGTVPEDQVAVRAAPGTEHLNTHVSFIRALGENTPLFIRQINVEDDTPFVDAIIDHGKNSPVTLVINRNMLIPAFAKKLSDAGITIREPKGVVHQKSLSTPDALFIYTGAYDRKSFEKKNDVGVHFTGGLARQYFAFEKLAASGASRFKIQDQLAELASSGIAIDAPHEGVTYAARSYWALARGAQRNIDLHVKELFDPRFFEFLVDRAKAGVTVKISLALEGQESIGKDSEELWQQAKADYPGLPLTVETQPGVPHRRHFNAIFADDFSAVGTLYPWVTAFNKVEPPKGREHMVILGKEGTARLKEEINGLGLAAPEPYDPRHT